MKLKDKVAIVTGGAQGIGEAIARRYMAEGANVAIADLNLDEAKATADKLTAIGPGKAIAVAMNVTDEDQVNKGIAQTVAQLGGVDILVSNAGVQIVHPVEEFPFGEWKKLLSIHLDGAFLTSKACLPHMYKKGSGSIIFMGSVHSKEASPLKSAYVTAKHGLLGISEQDVIKKVMLGNTVDGEFTTVEDVAEVALLFAGFETNALNGQSLVVSHGWYMN